ncbi:ANKL1 protein, partial [Pedionomus torquatus]|nr:ANKL1 protein [Pedionomus torquatus]
PELGGGRRSLSFLTEDGTDASVTSELPEDGPLSSTRRSLLEELALGGSCSSEEPPSLSVPFLAPWPPVAPRGSALLPQPLASSTLLSAGDELGERPQSWILGGRTGAPSQPSLPPGASSSPGSSPTVLLVPGDHGHAQDAPSDGQGSPGSSSTVLLVPGDHGHAQDAPSDGQGSPGSSSTVLLEPRSPVVLLSSTSHSKKHLKDEERGQSPAECHSPSTEATTSPVDAVLQDGRVCRVTPRPLSDEALRRQLQVLGDNPGPITELTRRLYLRRLEELLVAALQTGQAPDCAQDELALARQFDRPDRTRHWREGLVKSSFNYLLLDPSITQNLPLRSHHLSPAECFRTFVKAIFYVGKGTRARPYCHLAEALSQHRAGTRKGCPKVQRILEIWGSGQGVISVHCFQNTVPAEAYTREGCLVEALGLQTITNQRKGHCYGVAASWPAERRRRLGVHMLHRAMRIFLAEGERQPRATDIQGGR